jgi:transcriptional regulator GlxA family with amidase domain
MKTRNVSILIFDDVEVLDFCGPFEVFSVTGRRHDLEPFNVFTVAESSGPISARGGLRVVPHHVLGEEPDPDIVLVPGGFGTRREMHNERVIDWIRNRGASAELLLSVCTGSLLLAKAGFLEGLSATTHHGAFELLGEVAPNTKVDTSRRFVDNGRVITSAGVAAGIDMSFHVVSRLLGPEMASEAATYMEYDWIPADDQGKTAAD